MYVKLSISIVIFYGITVLVFSVQVDNLLFVTLLSVSCFTKSHVSSYNKFHVQ